MAAMKLVVVGDGACGKARLLDVFTKDEFPDEYRPTFFVEYNSEIKVDGELVKLSMWHVPGQVDYDRLPPNVYINVDVILICFSINSPTSLENVGEIWAPYVEHFCPSVPFLLIGGKADLRTDPATIEELARSKQHVVSPEEGRAMAERIRAWCYLECSPLKREGVREVFANAVRAVLKEKNKVHPYDDPISMSSLFRLEKMAGIKIMTTLAKIRSRILKAAGVTLNESQQNKLSQRGLEYAIDKWKSKKSVHPATWRSLLLILDMLSEISLSQKIGAYLDKAGYLSTYNEVIATHECIEMWFIKVILLGAPRLGKTTARRRLTGEICDISSSGEEKQPSTGAVESAPNIVIRNLSRTTALVTPTEWAASKDLTDEARMLIQFFHGHVQEKKGSDNMADKKKGGLERLLTELGKTDPSSTTPKREAGKSVKAKGFLKRKTKAGPTTPSKHTSKRQPQAMAEVAELFRNAVGPKYWNEVKHMFKNSAFLKMEDTGGQPEFMDMLPALTIGPALYLLFCKLTDDLKSRYTVSYLSPSGESTTPEESTYTMEELLLTALASISCFKSSSSTPQVSSDKTTTSSNAEELLTSCKSSLAYIVGTHKDKVSEQEIDEFDEKLQQSIRSTDFFREGLVQFASEKRMVLPIDNMNGGESEIKKIQTFLEEGMKQHFKKLLIPAAWLVLSLCLRKREERTASLQSVLQLAAKLGIPKGDVKSALQFLYHYAGVLMYFPDLEELKDIVICDTQVVYDSTTNLIVNTFKFGRVGKAASERFRKTGQFSLEDIRGATESVSGDFIPIQKLVKLLEHLNIIAPIVQSNPSLSASPQKPEVSYFMPCVLQNSTHDELDQWWASASIDPLSPAPLFIRYKCGYVPIGVFPAMIASLAGQKAPRMIYDGIKKNRVQFLFGSDFDTVTLISHPRYYAVHITRMPDAGTPIREVCSRIRALIESTLKTVTSHMNYGFHVEYQLSFECPSHPGRKHLCVVESDDSSSRFMLCLENMDNQQPKKMQRQHLVWLEKVCSITVEGTDFHEQPWTNQNFSSYVSALPPSARPHLELELDWGHDGVEKDLSEIADHMLDWEELSTHLGLTPIDIHDIKEIYSNKPVLQRREALSRWRNKQAYRATYGKLLELFVKAGHTQCAEAVCEVLRKTYPTPSSASKGSAIHSHSPS